jgi:signal transduction histidine kinase
MRRMEVLKQKAEAATNARDEVLATVSHDLKNPLGTIFTSATLLLDVELAPEAHRRQLEIIRRTAQRMDRLIQDLLDVSRMEAGRFSIDARPVSARSLVVEARELLSSIAQAKNIELVQELPPREVVVAADRDRVLQVFSNLIGNAIKFTPSGGRVTVRAQADGDMVVFDVEDTGIGISVTDLQRIFDRFWHAGEGSGSGLGLAIAKGIVEAHGGSIQASSAGSGSTFTFRLPLAAKTD